MKDGNLPYSAKTFKQVAGFLAHLWRMETKQELERKKSIKEVFSSLMKDGNFFYSVFSHKS